MAMAIGSDASNNVLNQFVSGTENKVFTAQDASQIKEFFKFVTMSVTTRTNNQNANIVPKPEEVEQLVEQSQEEIKNELY